MYTLNYEDSGTAPVSQSLKYVMDKDVQMVFAGGANNLARLVCSQEENERIIVFYDMPPNNLQPVHIKIASKIIASIITERKMESNLS